MSSSREKEASPGSLNHTLPVRSHTYMRPLFSKAVPTASVHGPATAVSVNPGGTVAAESSDRPTTNRQPATIPNHGISAARFTHPTWSRLPTRRPLDHNAQNPVLRIIDT